MIVHNLCVSDAALRPSKTDPVLSVDPDTVLARSVFLQRFEVVAGRDPEILNGVGVVENEQFRSGPTLEIRRTNFPCGFGFLAVEDVLSALIAEGQDHVSMIARLVCYDKREWDLFSNERMIAREASRGWRSELVEDFL